MTKVGHLGEWEDKKQLKVTFGQTLFGHRCAQVLVNMEIVIECGVISYADTIWLAVASCAQKLVNESRVMDSGCDGGEKVARRNGRKRRNGRRKLGSENWEASMGMVSGNLPGLSSFF